MFRKKRVVHEPVPVPTDRDNSNRFRDFILSSVVAWIVVFSAVICGRFFATI